MDIDSDVGSSMEDAPYEFDDEDMTFSDIMQAVHGNFPGATKFEGSSGENWIQSMSNENWEELGRGVSNNTHLETVRIYEGALNDERVAFFFRGLTRSSSISRMHLYENEIGVAGVRSIVPFLQNTANLRWLDLDDTNIQSEGFNLLLRGLRGSPVKKLSCARCGIESIEIDINNCFPQHLMDLNLNSNIIDADGCRGLAELLHREASTLATLCLNHNKIDDDAVEFLVDALQNNTSLTALGLLGNNDITYDGKILLLKLVNDVSSIKATLQSNHTLKYIYIDGYHKIQANIDMATLINRNQDNPEAGREKVIQTQLHSANRVELCRLQDVSHSVYRDIDPLHLPEVLSLIARHHGQEELYVALSSSIMILFSTMNVKKCIQQERAYHAIKAVQYRAIAAKHEAKTEQLDAKLAVMEEAAAGNEGDSCNDIDHRSNKRRRKWWWGLWGGA